ncbi:MAG: virulence protein SciE type [Halomonadaceae bacterium]|nr:MAG: virulence protein SciE type [Halomonadaceae bacterium]
MHHKNATQGAESAMDAIKEYLSAGQLQQAIDHCQNVLREKPGASDLRACLVELLCLAGELQRADDVLGHLAKHHSDWLAGAANLRQLLRAQQSRLALRQGQLAAEDVVATPGPALEALLALHLHLSRGEMDAAGVAAENLEARRTPALFTLGGDDHSTAVDLRDCDDSLNGYLEGLGTDGRYYLWQWSEIDALHFHPPTSPVEMIWRRADIELADGRQGEAFLPATYVDSESDSQRLGRETDWRQKAPGLVTGVGLKLFLLGNEAVTLDGLKQIQRQPAQETVDASF